MVKCPVCMKQQVVYVQAPARTICYYCGARWLQYGAEQEGVMRLVSPQSGSRSTRQPHPSTFHPAMSRRDKGRPN
jgi:hypothetical protein